MQAAKVDRQIRKKALIHESLPTATVVNSMAEDLSEEEAGERLYEIVCACEAAGIDAESALRKFTARVVREIEERAERP